MLTIALIVIAVAVALRIINSKLTPRTNTNNIAMFIISTIAYMFLGAFTIYQMQFPYVVAAIAVIVPLSLLGGFFIGFKHQIMNKIKA